MNAARPIDTRVVVAVHRETALSDDGDRKAACVAIDPVDPVVSELTHSLCKLIGVVH